MKIFLLLAVGIYGTFAALSREFVASEWDSFKTKFGRTFVNVEEESFRQQIFQKNLERFEAHNELYKQGLVTYTLGVNQFADMTPEEIRTYTHGLVQPKEESKPLFKIRSITDLRIPENFQIPTSLDWRYYGVVSPVKDQRHCGSCWAFATTDAIEAQQRIAYGSNFPTSISEQQLVDCTPNANGCNGGWMTAAYDYVTQNGGIDSDFAYPYESRDGICRYTSNQVAARLTGYVSLTEPDENLLAVMVANHGPVSVAINVGGPSFASFKNGVYYNASCDPYDFNHAVLIVGYGSENGEDYWLIKNSWGTDWGVGGYLKMARNRNNHCGIASHASYPVL